MGSDSRRVLGDMRPILKSRTALRAASLLHIVCFASRLLHTPIGVVRTGYMYFGDLPDWSHFGEVRIHTGISREIE